MMVEKEQSQALIAKGICMEHGEAYLLSRKRMTLRLSKEALTINIITMNGSINKILLRGNVGNSRIMNVAQGSVIRFTLATSEVIKDRNGNVRQETQWHNVVAWSTKGKPDFSKIVAGAMVELEGSLRYVK